MNLHRYTVLASRRKSCVEFSHRRCESDKNTMEHCKLLFYENKSFDCYYDRFHHFTVALRDVSDPRRTDLERERKKDERERERGFGETAPETVLPENTVFSLLVQLVRVSPLPIYRFPSPSPSPPLGFSRTRLISKSSAASAGGQEDRRRRRRRDGRIGESGATKREREGRALA